MNIKNIISLSILFSLLIWGSTVSAATFIPNEKQAATQGPVKDDLFIVGDSVSVNHDIAEDLYAAANVVNLNGAVSQDLHAAGNTVSIRSAVGDDIFAAGNIVDILSENSDDIFAAGNTVNVKVNKVRGTVFIAGNNVTLAGSIAGSVKASANVLTIKSGTVIQGDLTTYGQNEPTIEEGVTINGERKHVHPDTGKKQAAAAGFSLGSWVIAVITWFVVATVFLYLLPGFAREVATTTVQKSGRSLGIGFLWLIAAMPAIIIFFITVVGWPLALLTIFTTIVLMILSSALSTLVVGSWIMQKAFKRQTELTWQHAIIGAVVIKVIQLIPIVGWLIIVVLTILTLGSILQVLWQRLRSDAKDVAATPIA